MDRETMRSHAGTIPEATPGSRPSQPWTIQLLTKLSRRGPSTPQTQIQAVMPVNHARSRDLVAFILPWPVPQHACLMDHE